MKTYKTGAFKSPFDLRTFGYVPTKARYVHSAGLQYPEKYIKNQFSVGTCTATSATQHAGKALDKKWSDDFQYLCQKKFIDGNWLEGSSAFSACKVMHQIGLLPEEEWTHTTQEDKKLPYQQYIAKLNSISEAELQRLILIANKYKIKGYSKLPDVKRDTIANAIADNPNVGIITRYVIGSEWYQEPIEPLRAPKNPISGHLVNDTKVVGMSFRIANVWGKIWGDKGTAYYNYNDIRPTEAWVVYYNELPKEIQVQVESREQVIGKILAYIQQIIALLVKLK